MNKINQKQIVDLIHKERKDIPKKDIKEILDLCTGIIKENLENGVSVNLNKFATFKCVSNKPKKVYSFKSKSLVELPERRGVKTVFSTSFIKKIRNAGK